MSDHKLTIQLDPEITTRLDQIIKQLDILISSGTENGLGIELKEGFERVLSQANTSEPDEIGKGAEYAAQITGKAIPTIYGLVSKRLIPHSKRGGDLYFSKKDLLAWIQEGKR